jgi:hypothetical protein
MIMPLTWAGTARAGEGNRTLMTSLEGWGSAIELRPRWSRRLAPGETATRVAYRLRAAVWSADVAIKALAPAARATAGLPDRSRCVRSGARGQQRVGYGWPTGM